MKFYVVLIIFLTFLILTKASFAQERLFVGVSPNLIDLGELERETTNLVKFYVVTVSEQPLIVYLEAEEGNLDFFDIHYKNLIYNYSEESTKNWVKFLSNPVELKPQNETLKTDYETIRGWREVDFLLEIPKDAEPGYHIVKIKPRPTSTSTISGTVGTQLVAITSVSVFFKVVGDGIRKGEILDVTSKGYNPKTLEIDTHFQNTGTTTITAKAIQKIYDKDGNFITEISSADTKIKPNELKVIKSFLPLTGLSFGDYDVLTTVKYTTDSAIKNSTISVTPEVSKPKEEEFPIWLFIVFIILLISLAIYKWVQ
ncbi:MAG: hypothetical protein QXZ20_03970 [Candidatus Aenigmatarchaeota archaeon]